jgi:pimeloyl-ACP methyl ester carboxylesterase
MICNQANPTLLSHVSTAESARDMDLLRQAVGDSQLNYLGVSYGTYLGATYANLFPGKVRAMVLDGNINPVAWTTLQQVGRVQLSTGIRLESDLGAAATLKQFLNLCGEASTKGCAFSAGSARATEEKYANLLQHLRTHPVTIKKVLAEKEKKGLSWERTVSFSQKEVSLRLISNPGLEIESFDFRFSEGS